MRVEKHGFGELAESLESAGRDIEKPVAKVTGRALLNMKRDAQARVSGHPHLRQLPRSYTYDVQIQRGRVIGEVGAEHRRPQGTLDHLIEDGSPTSPPIPHWAPAADREVPVWQRYLDDVAAEVLDAR